MDCQNHANARNMRLTTTRNSLKCIPIVKQLSLKLQDKYEQLTKRKNRFNPQFAQGQQETSDCDSIGLQLAEEQENSAYNSFLQNYQMLQKLGEGGNGCVFKCLYRPNRKFYAAKKFLIQQQHVQYLKKSFINMKQLNHSSICRYRALYFDQNQRFAFLVMEYLPFPSLADYKIKSQEELKSIVRQIIAAVTYIHNRNLCHRDIKPENILYDEQTRKIKIIDFGISKKTYLRGVRRDMLTIIGTHLYLAPQVYNGGGYDQRIDLWALGVTVYRLITGYTPFQSEYHSDTISNILKGNVTFEQKIWKNYSPSAKYFVSQLLKKREERLTLGQAQKHFWLKQQSNRKSKVSRMATYNIHLSQKFHNQLRNNIRHANSKQQGSYQDEKKLYRSINLINVSEYQLQDSDEDEELVVTPKTTGSSSPLENKSLECFSDYSNYQCERAFVIKRMI